MKATLTVQWVWIFKTIRYEGYFLTVLWVWIFKTILYEGYF